MKYSKIIKHQGIKMRVTIHKTPSMKYSYHLRFLDLDWGEIVRPTTEETLGPDLDMILNDGIKKIEDTGIIPPGISSKLIKLGFIIE